MQRGQPGVRGWGAAGATGMGELRRGGVQLWAEWAAINPPGVAEQHALPLGLL